MSDEETEEDIEEESKYIYADSYKTKDLIWDAYDGFVQNYNIYIMYNRLQRTPIEIQAALNRYAFFFYEEVRYFIQDFTKELKETRVKEIETIMQKQKDFTTEEYLIMRRFFNDFMCISGIKRIVHIKDDVGKAITKGR